MLPALVAQVQDLAPRLRFQIVHAQNQDYAEDLASGRLDFALGYVEDMAEPAPGIELRLADRSLRGDRQPGSSSDPVRAQPGRLPGRAPRGGAPLGRGRRSHIELLERRGLRRDVAVQLPSVLAAPFIVAGSALIMTVPRQGARTLGAVASIVGIRRPSRSRPSR